MNDIETTTDVAESSHRYSDGYYLAVIGCTRGAVGKNEDSLAGWDDAVADGNWGSHPDYKSK